MSTSAVHQDTTIRPGHPGRFLGMVAAGLAAAITIGLVFAVNQGNEVTGVQSAVPAVQTNSAELNRLLGQIEAANEAARQESNPQLRHVLSQIEAANAAVAQSAPGTNIERYRLEIAGALTQPDTATFNIEQYRFNLEQTARRNDAWSQRYQGLAEESKARPNEVLQGRLSHEFPAPQPTDNVGAASSNQNPMEGVAE